MPGVGARTAEQQEVTLKHTVPVLGVEGGHQDVLGQLRALADHLVPEKEEKGMCVGEVGLALSLASLARFLRCGEHAGATCHIKEMVVTL